MRNIEIIIDASASANITEVEKYLVTMQMDPSLEKDNIQVSFFSGGEKINKNLNDLEIPLNEEDKNNLFGSGDDYNRIIKEKLKKDPDVLMFISDFMDRAMEKKSLGNSKTNVIFLCTQKDDFVNQFFLAEVKDLPNVKKGYTDKYISLDRILKNDLLINDKISKLRLVTNNETESRPKP